MLLIIIMQNIHEHKNIIKCEEKYAFYVLLS